MTDIVMPQLGESVTEGTITRWFKAVGDTIAEDEPLFEVSTDKVDTEVPAPAGGVLTEILVAEGDTVDVGTVLAVLGGAGATPAPAAAPAPAPLSLARAITINGVVQVGNRVNIIVQVPNEGSSRYVSVGDRLAGGRVLVKRVDMGGGEPRVVLEQDGVEVVRMVESNA